jgi:Ran GTPase-activating protein (RanGAP) involved in mRNA processing and transport
MLLNNHLSDSGVDHLSKILSTNNSTLKILGLGSNDITDNGVQSLARMLKINQSLTVLGLVSNEITDQGLQCLANVLANNNTTLQVLHLSKNQSITDRSVDILIEMFKKNHSLQALWMQNCKLSDDVKKRLRQITRSKTNFRLEF